MKIVHTLFRWLVRLAHWLLLPLLALACLILRLVPKAVDIGMGPQPLINNVYWARALRKKGYTVETFADETYRITNEFDLVFNHGLLRLYYYLPGLSFLRCALRYRCMYVYFDGGPLRHVPGMRLLEPRLFHLAGVKTVVMPYGSDVQIFERTPNKAAAHALCQDYPSHFQKDHKKIIRQVECWSRDADIVIGAMDSIDYLFYWNRLRLCHFAIDTDAIQPFYPQPAPGKTIKIIHAPNHTGIKGTAFIKAAVEALQQEGFDVELTFTQGVTNQQLLQLLQETDIVVDQLIMGAYAMFAMEAMTSGKPTIAYMRPDHVDFYEKMGCIEKGEIPLVQADIGTITQALRQLLLHPETLPEIGRKSREYAIKYHSLDAVGAFYDEINRSLGILPKNNAG